MAQILQPYQIGITQGDTSPDETLLDVFYSLERLNGTIDDIFGKVEKRVVDERDRINKINTRVEECRKIVQSIRGSKKATTIFSTAKFPAPKVLPAYPTLLSQVSDTPTAVYRELDENTTYYPPLAHESVVGNEEKLEESYLIYGRFNTHESDLEKVEFTMEDEGIGPYPLNRIKYIGSMLLFNTNINPYKNYETLDNFIQTGRVKEDVETETNGLAAAPNSLVVGDVLPDIEGLDFTFKPEMGEMEQLSLPDNLPLDFVAENINYQGADLPSIAPSAAKANYDLPQITDGGYDAGPTAKQKQSAPPPASIPVSSVDSNDNSNGKSAPPPPPPPPPMSTNTNNNNNNNNNNKECHLPPLRNRRMFLKQQWKWKMSVMRKKKKRRRKTNRVVVV
jgi:WAS protein family homolog 1